MLSSLVECISLFPLSVQSSSLVAYLSGNMEKHSRQLHDMLSPSKTPCKIFHIARGLTKNRTYWKGPALR